MAYAFNEDKTIRDLNGIIAYKDLKVATSVAAGASKNVYSRISVPDGFKVIGAFVLKLGSHLVGFQAYAIYDDSIADNICVFFHNASSTAYNGGATTVRVVMVKDPFSQVLT